MEFQVVGKAYCGVKVEAAARHLHDDDWNTLQQKKHMIPCTCQLAPSVISHP